MKALDVYLHRDLVGYLMQDEHGDIVLPFHSLWLGNSQACPLLQG